ncbi:head GIN domain-containing protein [Fulvivirgaceae bacterium BMA10]|uniref:Head GIN domain-containing protein n=1 Tax=Splendidivirga corallicola TaxID=3051826 RepID=A0ABT8KL55_9BACT|nr:head GIN domain-containing protein [Fulvivirgaceae bacterium BMA10]
MKRNNLSKMALMMCLIIGFVHSDLVAQRGGETIDLPTFDGISLGVAGTVHLKQGNNQEVIVETSEKMRERITFEVEGGTLQIKNKRKFNNWNWSSRDRLDIYITIKEVEALKVGGSGKIISETTLEANDLGLYVSGSGKIEIDTKAEDLVSKISGSGTIEIEGTGKFNDVSISGSGRLNAEDFECEEYDIAISGSGNCRVHVNSRIEARISGSGNVYYRGNPDKVISKVSGSGKLRKAGR